MSLHGTPATSEQRIKKKKRRESKIPTLRADRMRQGTGGGLFQSYNLLKKFSGIPVVLKSVTAW